MDRSAASLTTACVGLFITLFGMAGSRADVVPLALPQLAEQCAHAVTGTVIAVNSRWNEDRSTILTDIQLRVEDDLKGNFASRDGVLTLTELGGTVGAATITVTDTPSFNVGERVLVFTERLPDGRLIVLGRDHAKFTLTPAPGIALDEFGDRVDDGTGSPRGRLADLQERDLTDEVRAAMVARGYQPVRLVPSDMLNPSSITCAPVPENVRQGGTRASDGSGDSRACSGTQVYSDTGSLSYYAPGAGVPVADDMALFGNVGCQVVCYTLDAFAPSGSASYNVNAGLYTVDPTTGGIGALIPGTAGSWSGLAAASVWNLQLTLGSPVTAANQMWLVATFSTATAGWVVGGVASVGYTMDLFGKYSGGVWGYYWFSGSPYAGFQCSVYCAGSSPPPSITTVSPSTAPAGVGSAGPSGSLVTITGSNFGATKGVGDHVVFYSYTGDSPPMDWYSYNDDYITTWSGTVITCFVPADVSSKDCAVVKNGTWSNKPTFAVPYCHWFRWKDQSVMPLSYWVNASAISGVSGALAATQASLQTWENVTGDYLEHTYSGSTTRNASNHADGHNDIAWRTDWTAAGYSSGTIGQTTVSEFNGVIVEADMELNAQDFIWSSAGEAGKMDIQNCVTHEAGHGWVGLSDLYGNADSTKTMYGFESTGETQKRTLEPADTAGCQWEYASTYCPGWATLYDEYISNVTVGSINQSSSYTPGGYKDYTILSTSMTIGTGYGITVTNGNPWASDQCGVWVDWNHDLDFSDGGETITLSGGPGSFTGTITPPTGAATGSTRLRVRIIDAAYSTTFGPCGEALFGEVEDYTVIVVQPTGACCFHDGHCTQLTEADCTAQGGTQWSFEVPCIPEPCIRVGDLNCDGTYGYLSFGDINPFVLYLSDFSAWQAAYPNCDPRVGDINGDGTYGYLSFGDINPFVTLLTRGAY